MVINTNLAAMNASSLLMQSSSNLSQSLARLSSGSKITSPADDSAGLAVSMKLNAQMSRIDAATNNVNDANSFSQTQDGYIQQVNTAFSRMSELSVLSQDVTKTTADRALYQQEFHALGSYINNVATKDFNFLRSQVFCMRIIENHECDQCDNCINVHSLNDLIQRQTETKSGDVFKLSTRFAAPFVLPGTAISADVLMSKMVTEDKLKGTLNGE